MLDTDALVPWVSDELLTGAHLEELHTQMRAHPARMLVVRNFLAPDVAEALATFLRDGVEYRLEHGLYSKDGGVQADEWDLAPDEDRFFRFEKLAGIRPEAALEPSTITYMRFRSWVTQAAFRGFMEELTGLPLGESDDFGIHRFRRGDFLRDHDDDNRNRRIALVMYLTPDWQPEYGGALAMQHPDGTVETVQAEFNSMVVFDVAVESTHHVQPISDAAGERGRCTFGGWFPDAA